MRPRLPRPRATLALPRLHLLVSLSLLLAAAACGTDGDAPGSGGPPGNPFLGDGGIAALQLSQELTLDLTGDGVLEEVTISVGGEDPRALEIDMAVYGTGNRILYGSTWSSAEYPEFQRSATADAPPWVASQAARVSVPDVRIRELSASLAGRRSFSYMAGATFRTIAWSPELGRFVTVYECCP